MATIFQMTHKLSTFAWPGTISDQTVSDPSYFWEGKCRQAEDHVLFQYSISGYGIFQHRNTPRKIEPGMGFLCRISDPETSYYYPPDKTHPWHFVYFTFHNEHSKVAELVERFGHIYRLPLESTLARTLSAYGESPENSVVLTPGEGSRLVMTLLDILADSAVQYHDTFPNAWLVRKTRTLIDSRLEENQNINRLASELGVSHEHLSRTFKKETGQTPLQYLHQQKTRRICMLLKDSTLSCKEICYKMGYDNPSHFARSFKRIMGITPGRYRENRAFPLA